MDMEQPNNTFVEPNLPEGLVLYYHPKNFHSQKILFVLHEKNIKFTPYALDLARGEQYSSWFLNKNPKGEVPVLQDDALAIPNSKNILNYIEGKFKGERYPPVLPIDKTSKEYSKYYAYEKMLDQLPIGAISLGSFIHGEDLSLDPKPPFTGPVRQSCLENNERVYKILKELANKAVAYQRTALLEKLDLLDRRKQLIYSRVKFQGVLDKFEEVLKFFEKELEAEEEQEWLLSSQFYVVDITFGLLLHRLYNLGFANYFWTNGKLPKIREYLSRFRQRGSYKKVIPSNVNVLTNMWLNTPPQYKLGAGMIGMAMFAAFTHK